MIKVMVNLVSGEGSSWLIDLCFLPMSLLGLSSLCVYRDREGERERE